MVDLPPVLPEMAAAVVDVHQTHVKDGLDWFGPSAFIEQGWDLEQDVTHPWLRLKPKQPQGRVFKLLFIFPDAQVEYDRCVSKVLSVFSERGLVVEALIVLAGKDQDDIRDDVMSEAIQYAENHSFDLIYAVSSRSTAAVHRVYRGGRLPVVTALAKDPVILHQVAAYDQGGGANIAYTSVGLPISVQMHYLNLMMPEMKNILIVYDGTNQATIETQVIPLKNYIAEQFPAITVWDVVVQDPAQVRAELEDLIPQSLEWTRVNDRDGSGTFFLLSANSSIQEELDTLVKLAGKTSVFAMSPTMMVEGKNSPALAIGVSFDSNSLLAGEYGVRILRDGEKPGEMVVGVIKPPDIAISLVKVRELGLRIPVSIYESATLIYGWDGKRVR